MFRQVLLLAGSLLLFATSLSAQSNRVSGRVPLSALAARADTFRTGEQIYRDACVACHGFSGAGNLPELVVFQRPLPDFADCNFATSEASLDWFAVIHNGGPERGLSRMMPAFGDALTDEQIWRVIDYLRTFCSNPEWPRGELNLPRAQVTEKAYPEDEVVYTTFPSLERPFVWDHVVEVEHRIRSLYQWSVEVPFRFRQREDESGLIGGIGDLALGIKRVMYHSLERGTIISATLEANIPTGDEDEGFGSGTVSFEPFVSIGQLLPILTFAHFQVGAEFPTNLSRANPEAFWSGVLGHTIAEHRFGRLWSPMVEVIGTRELASGQSTLWSVLPQFQVTLSRLQHVATNVGVRVPFNHTEENRWQFWFYILWDTFDGPFFSGW